jgi:F-type H+-transporting ATPase subunit a
VSEALEIHVPIQPEVLFTIAGVIPVTNTLFTSWIVILVLIAFALLATRKMVAVPTGLQNVAEAVVEVLLALGEQVAGSRAREFLPLVATLFLYILFSNWIGIFPGFGSIPALRSSNSDLSITAAMALTVFVWVQVVGLRADPKTYFVKFVWPGMFIEIVTELARPVSLAFRLWGNIIAGFILVEVMLQIAPVVVPAAFLALELGVGAIQALIFAVLALAFLSMATAHGAESHAETQHAH